MVQNYIIDNLTLQDLNETGKVIIPNFQRGVVWSRQHRKDFIETVKTGDPFGVVLVHQSAPGEPYYLIDGLQRLSTLKAYMDNPLEFIDENDKFADQKKLHTIFEMKYESKGLQLPPTQKLNREIRLFLKKIISVMKSQKTTPSDIKIWRIISPYLCVDENNISILECFSEFYKSFTDSFRLPNIVIPAIVYQGSKDRLPYVFETLNTSSVSLTKYEVFSSQWPNTKIIVRDEELIEKVWSKYDGLKAASSFDVDVTKESIRSDGMTLFEFCFGFSELVCDDTKSYSALFSKSKKTTDPTGFEILALACGLPVNKADNLWKEAYLGGASGSFLITLKDALISSILTVYYALEKWITDMNGAVIKSTSTYQIYYMIISAFKHMYNLDLTNKTLEKCDDAENWIKKYKCNAYKWYLYQLIIGYWNQHRQVGDLTNLLNNETDIDYAYSISKEKWEDVLSTYCESNLDSCLTRIIPAETRLFLNYLYKLLIKDDANRAKYFEKETDDGTEISFDIEHIVPVSKFSNLENEYPMSTLGNLCYLPVKDNRSKRDHTIYEYALDRPSLTYNQDFLDMIIYPTRNELSFIDCKDTQFKEPFERFVKNREKKLIECFVELIAQS